MAVQSGKYLQTLANDGHSKRGMFNKCQKVGLRMSLNPDPARTVHVSRTITWCMIVRVSQKGSIARNRAGGYEPHAASRSKWNRERKA